MGNVETSGNPPLGKKHVIILLQWLIVIVNSYLTLFTKGEVTEDPWAHGLVLIFLTSALVLYRLPEEIFHHRLFDTVLLISDTLFISAAIYMKRDVPWDLFLFYFFILFIAAIGASMLKIVLGSVILSVIYVGLLMQQEKGLAQVGADLFVRIPFLFGVSILYGYLSESAHRERERAETAEQRERLKMNLVSSLAHDIKNPLTIIMLYAENLMDQLASRSDGKAYLESLKRIQHNGQRIVTLVTGFLDASKAEAGKLEIAYQAVAVNSLLKEVARQLEGDLEKKRLTLELKLDDTVPEFAGDEAQLDRVFWNLIGNAIKFTPPGGKITVSSSRDDGQVCVAIKDTGIGLTQDELPLLFSQFQRLKGPVKVEGTGLGLFIVKTIVEAHKGTVRVESAGQGSTFTIRIPIKPKDKKIS
jgi:signal transduction histidine kinase